MAEPGRCQFVFAGVPHVGDCARIAGFLGEVVAVYRRLWPEWDWTVDTAAAVRSLICLADDGNDGS